MVRGSAEVDDIVQEALARAWRFRGSCETPSAPEAWCAAIARNETLRHLKGRQAGARAPQELPVELPDQRAMTAFDAAVQRIDLDAALAAVTAQERRVLWLRYRQDLPTDEIAHLLHLNETTTRVQLHRARASLRRRMSS